MNEVMNKRKRLPWSEAPEWATVLLKSGNHFVFAESHTEDARAWPSISTKGNFEVIPRCWDLVETRPNINPHNKKKDFKESATKPLHCPPEWALEEAEDCKAIEPGMVFIDDIQDSDPEKENSGGSCSYYQVDIMNPTTPHLNQHENIEDVTYTAECNDILEALDMTYAEANIFKEIWRTAAARTLGKEKEGHSAKRGAEKIVFFAARNAIAKGVK